VRRPFAVGAAAALTLGIAVVSSITPAVQADTSTSGSATYLATCTNSVTPDVSELSFTARGTVPSSVPADSSFDLTGQNWSVTVPGSVFQTGINLGLITDGQTVNFEVGAVTSGSNTAEGTRQVSGIPASVTATSTGGVANDATVAFTVPDQAWTALSGAIEFRLVSAQVAVDIGLPAKVRFNCTATTTAPFVTTTATAAPTTTVASTTTEGVATTTTDAATTTTDVATTTTDAATTTAPPTTAPPTTAPPTTAPPTTAPPTTAPPTDPTSGSATYLATCTNSVTPDVSELSFTARGTVPSSVPADSSFDLTGQNWSVTVPGSVFQTGINLGLITDGQTVNFEVGAVTSGSNTAEGTRQVSGIPASVTATSTGGVANDATVAFTVPDQAWTALSGAIEFRLVSAQVAVDIGLPAKVRFNCTATTTAPFVTTTATGETTITTTTTTTTTTTVPPTTTAPPTTAATTTTVPPSATTVPAAPVTGSATYPTECTNSVTSDLSALTFVAKGTVLDRVPADQRFVLSDLDWSVTVPASVFQTGINLGLITDGQEVALTIGVGVSGSNTLERNATVRDIRTTVRVAAPGGTAADAVVPFSLADINWTALSGPIEFRFTGSNVSVDIGLPFAVDFSCSPTSTDVFVRSLGVGESAITTTTSVASSATATTAPKTLVATGAPQSLLLQVMVALLLLDLGYLLITSIRPPRRHA
jgi:hypothetical protein